MLLCPSSELNNKTQVCTYTVILTGPHLWEGLSAVTAVCVVVMRYSDNWGVKRSSGWLQRQQRAHHWGGKLLLFPWSLNTCWRYSVLHWHTTYTPALKHTLTCTHCDAWVLESKAHIATAMWWPCTRSSLPPLLRAHGAVCCWSRSGPEMPFTRLPSFIAISTATEP